MTTVHFNLPAELANKVAVDGLRSTADDCLTCLLLMKGDQVDETKSQWEPLLDDGNRNAHKWVAWPGLKYRVNQAVCVGISELLPGMPLSPVCWDHLAAMRRPEEIRQEQPAAPKLPGYAALPPGFKAGPPR
jgi:hypothetical protein